jgi:hypothetical protein
MTDAPKVRIGVGFTHNLGDFNSLRYDVAIEDSVRATDINTEAAVDRVKKLAERKVEQYIKEFLDEYRGK